SCDNSEARHGSAGARPSAGGLGAISGPPERRMSARRRRLAIAAVVILGLAGLAVWRFVLAPPALPPGVLAVSGRIEGDDSAVASKTSGRIREISVREGDRVEAGQVIAVLDDEQIRAREQQATAAVRQA